MKVSGAIIQNRFIEKNTDTDFIAKYKKHWIEISSDHGFGKPKHDHLTRFNIEVLHMNGGHTVDSYEDFHNIKDAIRFALKESCLLPYQGEPNAN